MSNYVPNQQKKKRILQQREVELRHALRHGVAPEKIERAATRVREAHVRALNAQLAQLPPEASDWEAAERERLLAARAQWEDRSAAAVVNLYRE